MKKFARSILLIMLFILLGAPSIYFDIMVPAVIDLPGDIETLAIIDRSHSENEVVNVLEKGLLSTITGNQDRLSKYCIDGVNKQVGAGHDFQIVVTGIVEKRKGTALDLPAPMQWFEINEICNQHNADAVLALEIFSRQYIDNVAEVKVGFRIYHPGKKMIIDEFQYYHGIGKGGRLPAEDPASIMLNAVNSDDAMKKASYLAGTLYGKRIAPFWIRAERHYYKRSKGDPCMKQGARMMEVNDWDAAITALQYALENGHRKTRGRAAHNLAVVYEITGQLDLARETAQMGWGKFGNKKARDYAAILQQRINEINMLRIQEEN